MIDFTLWDILRNLLLAARWTLALSTFYLKTLTLLPVMQHPSVSC